MTLFQSIFLGIIQGLTEFIPVSSSAHLVLVPYLLKWQIPANVAFAFDVWVQVATLFGVFIYFWKDLVGIIRAFFTCLWQRQPFGDPVARLGWYLILATIPAGLLGLGIKQIVEKTFSSPVATAFFLLVTAGLLLIAERIGKRDRGFESINWKDALRMGIFQGIAIFPGVSRSGSTITGGMSADLTRPSAARFSFLMSIPVMLAAGVLATPDIVKLPNLSSLLPVFLAGFVTAAIVGYFSIRWLLGYLMRNPLTIFAIYCILLSAVTLAFSFLI